MYSVYAADPQMRVNVGIRRRLAPLVENSRRRIELLNALLFSLPGHADRLLRRRDRDGRQHLPRRPQRRAHADAVEQRPQRRLLARRSGAAVRAADQDPVYGYQAINVEAQERYPVLAAELDEAADRDAQAAPRVRPRLARVRRLPEPQGARLPAPRRARNDPRRRQPVARRAAGRARPEGVRRAGPDRDERADRVPAHRRAAVLPDARARTRSYWFTLQRDPMQVTPRATTAADPNAAILESLPALLVGVDWQNVLDGGTRAVLERQALRPFLQRQRWFASKSREIRQARFTDWAPLRKGANAGVPRDRVGRVHRRTDRELSRAAVARSPARRPRPL